MALSIIPAASISTIQSPTPMPTYTIGGSLARWPDALAAAKAGNGLATVTVFGDSITQGYSAHNFLTASFVGQLQAALTGLADGGSGFQSVANSRAGNASATLPYYISQSGAWGRTNEFPGYPNGMIVITQQPVYALSHGMTWTTARGRYLDIWYVKGSNLSFGCNIDSTGAHLVDASGAGYARVTVDTKSAPDAVHLVQIASAAVNNGFAPLGVTGRNSTGVIVHNMGLWGRSMASGASDIDASLMGANLVVLSLSVNDATSNESVSAFQANAESCARSAASAGADLLVIIQHPGISANGSAATQRYTDIEKVLIVVAQKYGAPIYDLWARGNRDPMFMQNQGYSNLNDLHPNDLNTLSTTLPSGHTWIAQPLITFLEK